jgi:hypothetical protein
MDNVVAKVEGFDRSVALLVGIDRYRNGVPELKSAVADAEVLADALKLAHGFEATVLKNEQATLGNLRSTLEGLETEIGDNDRALFYFAGHGVATDSDQGPRGFVLPVDADRSSVDSYLSMVELHDMLSRLKCRHMLVLLDCCFAGAFRWSSYRHLSTVPSALHQERYRWFVTSPAWQVITSAAHDQKALDVVAFAPIGIRDEGASHSPFASALMRGLSGEADRSSPGQVGDGVITATDLFTYVEEQLLPGTDSTMRPQSPLMWPLRKHDRGQFIFLAPGRTPALPPAPPLDTLSNPWRGLKSYEAEDAELFFGRWTATQELLTRITGSPGDSTNSARLLVVTGPSGSGKSSLVKAGLLPRLPSGTLSITMEPGRRPFHALADALRPLGGEAQPDAASMMGDPGSLSNHISSLATDLVLVVDQAEELVTQGRDATLAARFLAALALALDQVGPRFRLVLTLRSEFEPQFSQSALKSLWASARFLVPPLTQDELRRIIERPAAAKVIRFESDALVDRLVNDVVQMPGALPLLSFGLSQLYEHFLERRSEDRTITEADYAALEGGITGALRVAANKVISGIDDEHRAVARGLLERFVSVEAGEFARRRVPRRELESSDPAKQELIDLVLKRLDAARLIVSNKAEGEPYVELAHDALILGWDSLTTWLRQDADEVSRLRRLTVDSEGWRPTSGRQWALWDDPAQVGAIRSLQASPFITLSETEAAFADASLRRANRNFFVRTTAVVALALVATVAAWFAYSTEQQRQVSESNRLALASRLTADLDQSMLVAVSSARLSPGVQARSALFSALSRRPQLARFLHGATGSVSNVTYLTDERVLALSSGQGGAVMSWDLSSEGAPAMVVDGLERDVDEFVLINGLETLVVRRGTSIGVYELDPKTAAVSPLADVEIRGLLRIFGKPDNDTIFAAVEEDRLFVLDGRSARELSQQTIPGSEFETLWLEASGSSIILQSGEGVWAQTSADQGWESLRGPPPEGYVFVDLWSGPTHRVVVSVLGLEQNLDSFPALPADDKGFVCWAMDTGQASEDCPDLPPIASPANVGFVDGKRVLVSTRDVGTGYQRAEYRAKVGDKWSADLLRVDPTFVTSLTMSPDGRSMIVATIDGEVVEYSLDAYSGGLAQDLSAEPILINWDATGCSLLLKTDNLLRTARCDLIDSPGASLSIDPGWDTGPSLTADERSVYALDRGAELLVWDGRLREVATIPPPPDREFSVLMDVLFDPLRARVAVVIESSSEIWSYDLATKTWSRLATAPFAIRAVGMGEDGTIFVGDDEGGGMMAIDPATGDRVFEGTIPDAEWVSSFTPTGKDGPLLVSGMAVEHRLFLVDPATGALQSENFNQFSGPAFVMAADNNAGYFVIEGVGTPDERPIEGGAFVGLSVELWDFEAMLPLGDGMRTTDYDRDPMAFAPSGDELAMAFTLPPRLVKLPLEIDDWVVSACARAGRDITPQERVRFGVPADLTVCPTVPSVFAPGI